MAFTEPGSVLPIFHDERSWKLQFAKLFAPGIAPQILVDMVWSAAHCLSPFAETRGGQNPHQGD
jgi:hypothetical protein